MSKDSSNYGYDPFASGSQNRWGRRGASDVPAPEIPGYEFIDNLGSGGMGSVWSARYLPLNQIRAVKILDKHLAQDPTFLERFSEEAKALGRLEHSRIVKVFDANASHSPPYIAMQWVEGKTLSDVLRERKVSIKEALGYFMDIAEALDYAHSQGLVHRDIKPSNVMVSKNGHAMLIDFGVASLFGGDPSSAGTITGTTRYLSPEVCAGKPATSASDVWAFSVTIFRTLTGSLPFDDRDSKKVIEKILSHEPLAPHGVSGRLAKFMVAVLEKDPRKRHKSAVTLVKELQRAASPWIPKPEGERSRLSVSVGLVGAGIVLLGAVGGIIAFQVITGGAKPKMLAVESDLGPVATNAAKGPNLLQLPEVEGKLPPIAAIVQDLRGIWHGDLGTRYAEMNLVPAGGRSFVATLRYRGNDGVVTVSASGEVGEDDRTIQFKETSLTSTPDASYQLASFTGNLSEDRKRLGGTFDGADQVESVRFMRAADLTLTTTTNTELGFSAALPAGWSTVNAPAATESAGGSVQFSPIGYPEVFFRVVVASETSGRPLLTIFLEREAVMQMDATFGASYQQIAMNTDTNLSGRTALQWDFRTAPDGTAYRNSVTAIQRGDRLFTVETSVPAPEEEVWQPILERMRAQFTLLD